jgi:hypothetical protein
VNRPPSGPINPSVGSVTIRSCHSMLGVGMVVPPIINAFNGSTGLSARAVGAAIVDVSARNSIEAPANSANDRERRTGLLRLTATPRKKEFTLPKNFSGNKSRDGSRSGGHGMTSKRYNQ